MFVDSKSVDYTDPVHLAVSPGSQIENGIYLGVWQPSPGDHTARYHVIAAPSDLADKHGHKLYTQYKIACHALARRRSLYGLPTGNLRTGYSLIAALQTNQGFGQWVIPPIGVVEMLYALRQAGQLPDTFGHTTSGGRVTRTYGSSSQLMSCPPKRSWDGKLPPDYSNTVRTLSMASGNKSWSHALRPLALYRPVFFIPVT